MNQDRFSSKLVFIAAFTVLAILVAGCAAPAAVPPAVPPATDTPAPALVPVTGDQTEAVVATLPPPPVPKNSAVTLADGTKIILQPDTIVEVISNPEASKTEGEEQILLVQGDILVIPNPENGLWFSVKNPDGFMVKIKGCAMMVSMDAETNDFGVKCLGEECEASNAAGEMVKVNYNEGMSYMDGVPFGPEMVTLDELEKVFGEYLPECVSVIPVTGGQAANSADAEATINAEATSSCGSFQSQFPGTPCP